MKGIVKILDAGSGLATIKSSDTAGLLESFSFTIQDGMNITDGCEVEFTPSKIASSVRVIREIGESPSNATKMIMLLAKEITQFSVRHDVIPILGVLLQDLVKQFRQLKFADPHYGSIISYAGRVAECCVLLLHRHFFPTEKAKDHLTQFSQCADAIAPLLAANGFLEPGPSLQIIRRFRNKEQHSILEVSVWKTSEVEMLLPIVRRLVEYTQDLLSKQPITEGGVSEVVQSFVPPSPVRVSTSPVKAVAGPTTASVPMISRVPSLSIVSSQSMDQPSTARSRISSPPRVSVPQSPKTGSDDQKVSDVTASLLSLIEKMPPPRDEASVANILHAIFAVNKDSKGEMIVQKLMKDFADLTGQKLTSFNFPGGVMQFMRQTKFNLTLRGPHTIVTVPFRVSSFRSEDFAPSTSQQQIKPSSTPSALSSTTARKSADAGKLIAVVHELFQRAPDGVTTEEVEETVAKAFGTSFRLAAGNVRVKDFIECMGYKYDTETNRLVRASCLKSPADAAVTRDIVQAWLTSQFKTCPDMELKGLIKRFKKEYLGITPFELTGMTLFQLLDQVKGRLAPLEVSKVALFSDLLRVSTRTADVEVQPVTETQQPFVKPSVTLSKIVDTGFGGTFAESPWLVKLRSCQQWYPDIQSKDTWSGEDFVNLVHLLAMRNGGAVYGDLIVSYVTLCAKRRFILATGCDFKQLLQMYDLGDFVIIGGPKGTVDKSLLASTKLEAEKERPAPHVVLNFIRSAVKAGITKGPMVCTNFKEKFGLSMSAAVGMSFRDFLEKNGMALVGECVVLGVPSVPVIPRQDSGLLESKPVVVTENNELTATEIGSLDDLCVELLKEKEFIPCGLLENLYGAIHGRQIAHTNVVKYIRMRGLKLVDNSVVPSPEVVFPPTTGSPLPPMLDETVITGVIQRIMDEATDGRVSTQVFAEKFRQISGVAFSVASRTLPRLYVSQHPELGIRSLPNQILVRASTTPPSELAVVGEKSDEARDSDMVSRVSPLHTVTDTMSALKHSFEQSSPPLVPSLSQTSTFGLNSISFSELSRSLSFTEPPTLLPLHASLPYDMSPRSNQSEESAVLVPPVTVNQEVLPDVVEEAESALVTRVTKKGRLGNIWREFNATLHSERIDFCDDHNEVNSSLLLAEISSISMVDNEYGVYGLTLVCGKSVHQIRFGTDDERNQWVTALDRLTSRAQ